MSNESLCNYDPTQSPLIGFARSLAFEYPKNHLRLIDLQFPYNNTMSSNLVNDIIHEIDYVTSSTPVTKQEQEIVLLQTSDNLIQRYKIIYEDIQQPQVEKLSIKRIIHPNIDTDRFHLV
ncbi:unnamed protein product [Didymodactylos carnosus]|uniref:Uncharacterized protein n=1 Tax=Didymodactylos carnosus TaxID=1234261 RepID=A0A815BEW8_9BILA|nr:unnamed protein product [Didymodactylos carnosus]CAF4054012.1 unnamed protein product [Didymodactylos carnosus]